MEFSEVVSCLDYTDASIFITWFDNGITVILVVINVLTRIFKECSIRSIRKSRAYIFI